MAGMWLVLLLLNGSPAGDAMVDKQSAPWSLWFPGP